MALDSGYKGRIFGFEWINFGVQWAFEKSDKNNVDKFL